MGWIATIIVGGIAGWLAEQFMKSEMGILMNIILGIVGAFLVNFILGSVLGLYASTSWISYLIVGFVGASALIWIARKVRS
ncbi:GlsB/YeaQ/YmgE family stress response membrane protein [Palleronia caenipelagi]|uniref:GlsB/YeaQ/YmgE family stress response membrane protein n=1 Tax=Palleronia caenipelagi TaxID=2489174 RepID=A0A547Q2L1_9RHOB|nr:GlsB/YeaQ/YmgE family stress response membrane protein [Palleronia caenipelagi]TRD20626.1 GlsB/YeaQ/YmgE family stress response membrane protein [Palleronia caenipelagi]